MSKYTGRSLRLVVDASVAKAAGDPMLSADAAALAWAATLSTIQRICHRVVVCDALLAEWNRHSGAAFRRWRKRMLDLDKVIHMQQVDLEDVALRLAVDGLRDEGAKLAIGKDLHLIELAMRSDRWIFSADEKIKRHLAAHSSLASWNQAIRWGASGTENVPPREK